MTFEDQEAKKKALERLEEEKEAAEDSFSGQRCFYCGSQCIWQNDFSGEDYGYGDREYEDGTVVPAEDQIVSIWICPNCGAEYEIRLGDGHGEEV